jgi:predicted CopG family antitoxin
MAIKTVSLRMEAYERLRSARRYPGESFSQVVLRARWPEQTISGAELLQRTREHGPYLTEEQLALIEDADRRDRPPGDKWAKH